MPKTIAIIVTSTLGVVTAFAQLVVCENSELVNLEEEVLNNVNLIFDFISIEYFLSLKKWNNDKRVNGIYNHKMPKQFSDPLMI